MKAYLSSFLRSIKPPYAIESKYVKEVFPFKEATPLFEKLPYFKGLLNRKRRVVALIDLAVFLHLSESSPSSSLAMLLTDGIREFAVWIESVERVESLLTSRICFFSLPLEKSHIKGMADNHLPILDGAALLEDPLLVIQENAYCEGGMFKENK